MQIFTTTAANEVDIKHAAVNLPHGKEEQVWVDSGCRNTQVRMQGVALHWHIAARLNDKTSIPAKVAQSFRMIQRQFGVIKIKGFSQENRACHDDLCLAQSMDGGKNSLDAGAMRKWREAIQGLRVAAL